jgi:hypothetical protein
MHHLTRTILTTAAALLLAPAAWAHTGTSGAAFDSASLLQAERYDAPASNCDPDGDGEHTQPAAGGDGSTIAFLPSSYCSITFYSEPMCDGSFTAYRARMTGTSGTQSIRLRVWVDGSYAGYADGTHTLGGAFATVPFTWSPSLSAGTHTITVDFYATTGFSWTNLFLDWVEFQPTYCPPPPPPPPPDPEPGPGDGGKLPPVVLQGVFGGLQL